MPAGKEIACKIRSAKNDKEIHELWWPLMSDLKWERSPHDQRTHVYSSTMEAWLMAIPTTTPAGEPYPEDGPPQGVIIPFVYSNSTGWIAFFVLNEAYRGFGIGAKLFKAAMDYHHEKGVQYVGLDAVRDQRATYGRRGFEESDLIGLYVRSDLKEVPPVSAQLLDGESIIGLKSLEGRELLKSDFEHTGLERTRLWTKEAILEREDATGFAIIDQKMRSTGQEGWLKGWILVRSAEHGYRVGPLYAQREETASLLLHGALESLEKKDSSLIAEVWRSNKESIGVFEGLGWKWLGVDYHRMWYKKRVPEAQLPGGKAETGMFAVFDAAEG